MKRLIYIIGALLLLLSINSFAGTEILCTARYLYDSPRPPQPLCVGYSNGRPIFVAGGGLIGDSNYEKVWSKTYTLNIKFFSGYELNEYYNQTTFNDNSIIAIVSWDNGGYSVITIENWVTNINSMTEDEIKYNSNGERISSMTGHDKEGRYWELYF